MNKLKFILSSIAIIFAITASVAFKMKDADYRWFARDIDGDPIGSSLPSEPNCIADPINCVGLYEVNASGQAIGNPVQTKQGILDD